jgi:hypothetical protein
MKVFIFFLVISCGYAKSCDPKCREKDQQCCYGTCIDWRDDCCIEKEGYSCPKPFKCCGYYPRDADGNDIGDYSIKCVEKKGEYCH